MVSDFRLFWSPWHVVLRCDRLVVFLCWRAPSAPCPRRHPSCDQTNPTGCPGTRSSRRTRQGSGESHAGSAARVKKVRGRVVLGGRRHDTAESPSRQLAGPRLAHTAERPTPPIRHARCVSALSSCSLPFPVACTPPALLPSSPLLPLSPFLHSPLVLPPCRCAGRTSPTPRLS
jgi:hypothetical protein